MGVKQQPWWPFLKFEHHMVPLLHCLIGIRNNLLDTFCDIIRVFLEKMSTEEIKSAQKIATYEIIIVTAVKERDDFDKSPDGKRLKSLQGMIASQKRKFKDKDTPHDNVAKLKADIKIKDHEMKLLLVKRQKMVERLKGAQNLLTKK